MSEVMTMALIYILACCILKSKVKQTDHKMYYIVVLLTGIIAISGCITPINYRSAFWLSYSILIMYFVMAKINSRWKKAAIGIPVLLVSLVIFQSTFYYSKNITVSGVLQIIDKYTDKEICYLVVDQNNNNVNVKCDSATYENVIIDPDVLYSMEFKSNQLDLTKGKLSSIDLNDYVDNRGK